MNIFAAIGQFFRRSGEAWGSFYKRRDTYSAVDLADPVELALADTQLLLAFAVQSSRKLNKEKVIALTRAADALRRARLDGNDPDYAAKASAFWIAFDEFAVDMAPLSAYSIRSSIEINGKCMPASLTTPTACNALFAVIVFVGGMALQGFWVSGNELIDMAAAYQVKRTELNGISMTKLADVEASFHRLEAVRAKIGQSENCAFDIPSTTVGAAPRLQNAGLKESCAEFIQAVAAVNEKKLYAQQASNELQALVDKNRPLTALVVRWYDRSAFVCSTFLLSLLCPVERRTDFVLTNIETQLMSLRKDVTEHELRTNGINQAAATFGGQDIELKRKRLAQLEAEKLKALEPQFASVQVQSKMIVANVGAYLIPMLMGVLGSLTFILRSLSQTLRDHTYVPSSASNYIVRICLGAIAGVFGGLLATAGDPTFKTLSLPPLFIPFVFGYGIEILFALLDRVVRTFTQPESGANRTA
jgi:hypothetical protein